MGDVESAGDEAPCGPLRLELNWQGSGFPTLRRYEVEFVSASLSYARGEPIVSDDKYEAGPSHIGPTLSSST